MKNIEIKARCSDLEAARRIADELGASLHAVIRQVDTYFAVAHGRLKLRQSEFYPIGHGTAPTPRSELIYYRRPDQPQPKASEYEIAPVDDGELLRLVLTQALGVRTQVSKQRAVYLLENVRIHLDDVEGLGTFIEFEVVLSGGASEAAAISRADELMEVFGISKANLVSESYSDLAHVCLP